jgi:dolichol-phosphate mannosyltransferase
MEGMRQAHGAILVVMDADLSHPPETIPQLVHVIQSDKADFAIGSRYVTGGHTDEKWGIFRWINSKVATLLARPLTNAQDPMAGFFALRRAKFQSAAHLDPIGYKIGLELIVKCGCRRIKEVPIFFGNRVHGKSKLSLKEQLNYVRHLKRLYEYKLGVAAEPLKFVLVGTTGMCVDLTVFALLLQAMPPYLGRALAIWVAMTWNYWLNRRLTFSLARSRPIFPQYVLFCLSCLMGALVNWSIFTTLYSAFTVFADWLLIAAFLGILGGTALNYLLSKYVAFK